MSKRKNLIHYTTFKNPNVWKTFSNPKKISKIPPLKEIIIDWKDRYLWFNHLPFFTVEKVIIKSNTLTDLTISNRRIKSLEYTQQIKTLYCFYNLLKHLNVNNVMITLCCDNTIVKNTSNKRNFESIFIC